MWVASTGVITRTFPRTLIYIKNYTCERDILLHVHTLHTKVQTRIRKKNLARLCGE